jgi:hypothetical protein
MRNEFRVRGFFEKTLSSQVRALTQASPRGERVRKKGKGRLVRHPYFLWPVAVSR